MFNGDRGGMGEMRKSDSGITSPALVDVILPAFNAAATIETSIRSLQHQSLNDIRVLVIDDGSSDSTASIVATIAAHDPRIKLVSQPNGGIVAALNRGLSLCTAEYVARLDADDISFPDRLAEQRRYLERHVECVAVDGEYWLTDTAGRRTGYISHSSAEVRPDAHAVPSREPYLMHPFLMARRRALLTIGGYRYVFHSEDADLYWRLLAQGALRHLPSPVGEYRVHASSVSNASIINGRIAAAMAQLAALSYRRSLAGAEDITFPASQLMTLQDVASLPAIIEELSRSLNADEARYLRLATCAKLLQLSFIRTFQLERGDIMTMRRVFRDERVSLSVPDRDAIRWDRRNAARALLRTGRPLEAALMLPPIDELFGSAIGRLRRKLCGTRVAPLSEHSMLEEGQSL